MTKQALHFLLPAFLILALLSPTLESRAQTGQAEEDADDPWITRVYPLYYLNLAEAQLLLEEKVPTLLDLDGYNVRQEHLPSRHDAGGRPRGYLRIRADAPHHERIAEILDNHDAPAPTQIFQLFLLRAVEKQLSRPDLTPQAHDALHDLSSIMPFKGFELVDSAFIRTSHEASTKMQTGFEVSLQYRLGPSPDAPFRIGRFILDTQETRLMDTSFSMKRGETVVVGTSKLNGGEDALVVLLTAME
jgi:hypothetical protein